MGDFYIDDQLAERNAQLRRDRLSAARAKGTHTSAQWAELVADCGNRCVRCGAEFNDSLRPQRDHITPIYQGGSDGIDNLQPLCLHCNTSKGPENTDCRPEEVRARWVG